MNPELSPKQALLIFGLLARHGECTQKDLSERTKVEKADREALEKARLISVSRPGRGFYLTLVDAGWAWAATNLSAELPKNQGILHDLLGLIARHLEQSGKTLADVIGSKPAGSISVNAEGSTLSGATLTSSKSRKGSIAEARKEIKQAYLDITGGHTNKAVLLAELRPRLPNIDPKTFDAALEEMHLEAGKVRLMCIENNRAVTEADKRAAFHFKDITFHTLWIES